MQRGRGDFFDLNDPFARFGGFGEHRSLVSSFFGKDPFDDPFFTRPFGSMFGPSVFGSSIFGAGGGLFGDSPNSGFLEHQAPQANKPMGLVIEELSSDDEKENEGDKGEPNYPRKHSRTSKEQLVEDPDDEIEERKSKHIQRRSEYNQTSMARPHTQTYSFQSSTVTYGGANGAYYTSSTTRRMRGGVMVEEKKEADTSTGRATHRISRGIHNKGHSVARKLNPDGNVVTVQTLHNLNEDELAGFEKAWKRSERKYLPGWNAGFNMINNDHAGTSGSMQNASRARALPLNRSSHSPGRMRSQGANAQNSSVGRT